MKTNKKANVWITLFVFMVLILLIASATMLWIAKKQISIDISNAKCAESVVIKEQQFNFHFESLQDINQAALLVQGKVTGEGKIRIESNCTNFYVVYEFSPRIATHLEVPVQISP